MKARYRKKIVIIDDTGQLMPPSSGTDQDVRLVTVWELVFLFVYSPGSSVQNFKKLKRLMTEKCCK